VATLAGLGSPADMPSKNWSRYNVSPEIKKRDIHG